MTATENKKSMMLYVHFAIMCLIMFGFRFLPPFLAVTPEGMAVLGVFLGWLYGVCFADVCLSCMMGFIGVSTVGIMPITEYYVAGFASETAVILLFSMLFIGGLVEKFDLTNLLMKKMFTVKMFYGKPWVFSAGMLILSYLVCTLTNPYIMVLFIYQIIMSISKQLGFKPYSVWPSMMIIGSTLLASISIINMPYKSTCLMFFGIFSNATGGMTMNWGSYLLWINLIAIIGILFYILVCRVVFRPDISALAKLDASFFAESEAATKEQKIALVMIGLFVVVLLAYGFIPEGFVLKPMITAIGLAGLEMILVVIALLIRVNGKPFITFLEMAKTGMQWTAYLLVVFALPMMTLLTNEATGITPSLMMVLMPILEGHSPIIFVVIIVVIASILTNGFNNMVVIMVLMPILCGYALQIGLNPALMVTMLILCGYFALLLPAGSPLTAIMFGYREFVNMKVAWLYGGLALVVMLATILLIGYPLGNMIF